MNLDLHLRERQAWVEKALNHYLPTVDEGPARLIEAMRYSVFAPGKRLRPILVLDAAEAVGGDATACLPTACALECIHTYSLIHDDLPCMDDDDLRRGRPSCHRAFDEATALLAGDALLTLAFRLVALNATLRVEPARVLPVVQELSEAAGWNGMVGGQMVDLEWEDRTPTAEVVEAIHLRKTTALIRAAVRCGALLAGASTEALAALSQYGQGIGLAFQIVDDLLDLTGDEAVLGKPVGRDVALRKATYPAVHGLEASQALAQDLITDAVAALANLGAAAEPLRALAQFIVSRRF
jgi:geranylgeranyl diphosphate synthase type II